MKSTDCKNYRSNGLAGNNHAISNSEAWQLRISPATRMALDYAITDAHLRTNRHKKQVSIKSQSPIKQSTETTMLILTNNCLVGPPEGQMDYSTSFAQ